MPPDSKLIRRAGLAALGLATLALGACANTPLLMPYPSESRHEAKRPPPPNPQQLNEDLTLVQQWLDASKEARTGQLALAEAAYHRSNSPRDALRLALLLGIPGTNRTDLPRAEKLLKSVTHDPSETLLPAEHTLAQLALSFIADGLTQTAKTSTLQTADTARIAQLKAQLDAVTDQDVALRRQLAQARAKLAAIANIEKSLNEGKLGPPRPPR